MARALGHYDKAEEPSEVCGPRNYGTAGSETMGAPLTRVDGLLGPRTPLYEYLGLLTPVYELLGPLTAIYGLLWPLVPVYELLGALGTS